MSSTLNVNKFDLMNLMNDLPQDLSDVVCEFLYDNLREYIDVHESCYCCNLIRNKTYDGVIIYHASIVPIYLVKCSWICEKSCVNGWSFDYVEFE